MFDEPNEAREEHAFDPVQRAKEKSDEFRMHAEICAVFEGHRKFDAQVVMGLGHAIARDIQQRIGRLEKAKSPDTPVLPAASTEEASALLILPAAKGLSTNDYHIHRRPGEVMIVRWLEGDQVDAFYERLQAHFDAAVEQFRDEERQAQEWKKDPATLAYLKALDELKVNMADRYLREVIRKHNAFVLSTLSADEIDILYLCDYVMGVSSPEIVGDAAAPGEDPTEQERAWFFRLFALRGMIQGVERMCFFAYLQKSDDGFDDLW